MRTRLTRLLAGCLLALTLLLAGAQALAWVGERAYTVAAAEVEHLKAQGFPVPEFGYTWYSADWEASATRFNRPMLYSVTLNVFCAREDRCRATMAHEVGHLLVWGAGLSMPLPEEHELVDTLAACYASPRARVWMRINRRLWPSPERCAEVKTMLIRKEGAPDAQADHPGPRP